MVSIAHARIQVFLCLLVNYLVIAEGEQAQICSWKLYPWRVSLGLLLLGGQFLRDSVMVFPINRLWNIRMVVIFYFCSVTNNHLQSLWPESVKVDVEMQQNSASLLLKSKFEPSVFSVHSIQNLNVNTLYFISGILHFYM